ncbi:threonine/homoserine efflux transporter RhtA [Pseudomonas duriflava]|uniref:Threonine/homoserine efflux transporter RhtA n=1 Tax=Pseudomonas duriflava TaxID=459528 RepID=A0A562Q8X8_9PSED|nr:EamA family transporter [Pseudomonas duriflava]TWI52486.1 threonine/homoserine efflux transporter RhtA [Pseudomonas duriflava]
MVLSPASWIFGVASAFFATACWALNFVTPYVTGAYSAYDFILLRFLFSGALGLLLLASFRQRLANLNRRDILLAFTLGTIGYTGYFSCIMAGVMFAGPVITPAFVGLVPILLALLGNARKRALPWKKLAIPLCLVAGGLSLANLSVFSSLTLASSSLTTGVAFSLGAVALWLLFSVFNQNALERKPDIHLGTWTALMMVGACISLLLLFPFGLLHGVFKLFSLGMDWHSAGSLYAWAFSVATLSSLAGAWAWNIASHRLPMVVTGQLISLETLFATAFGLIAEGRLPTVQEACALLMLLSGAAIAVKIASSTQRSSTARL